MLAMNPFYVLVCLVSGLCGHTLITLAFKINESIEDNRKKIKTDEDLV